jgi:hypothetical protein
MWPDDVRDLEVGKCADCQFAPCEEYTCPQGRVTGSPIETKAGKVIRVPVCDVQCAAGTFLTCQNGPTCKYQAYSDVNAAADARVARSGSLEWFRENMMVVKTDANVLNPGAGEMVAPPVQGCYPCRHAVDLMHYKAVSSTDEALRDKGYLRFFCPGGELGPVRCPSDQVTRVDDASGQTSACGCRPGYFINASYSACRPCIAGHFCAWNGMTPPSPEECPADQYSAGGASECTPCDMGRRCDAGQALTRCKKSQGNEPKGAFQKENAFCVDCNRCQQLQGSLSLPDAVPCYKVSPRIS